jgi:hypothetical protein
MAKLYLTDTSLGAMSLVITKVGHNLFWGDARLARAYDIDLLNLGVLSQAGEDAHGSRVPVNLTVLGGMAQ